MAKKQAEGKLNLFKLVFPSNSFKLAVISQVEMGRTGCFLKSLHFLS